MEQEISGKTGCVATGILGIVSVSLVLLGKYLYVTWRIAGIILMMLGFIMLLFACMSLPFIVLDSLASAMEGGGGFSGDLGDGAEFEHDDEDKEYRSPA